MSQCTQMEMSDKWIEETGNVLPPGQREHEVRLTLINGAVH